MNLIVMMIPVLCFQKDVRNHGISVLIASNPRNPTGQVHFKRLSLEVFSDALNPLLGYQVSLSRFATYLQGLTSQRGNDLKELVSLSREGTTLILDEVGKSYRCFASRLNQGRSSTLGTYIPTMTTTLANLYLLRSTSMTLTM